VRPVGDVLLDPFAFTGQAWDAYRPAFTAYVTVPLLLACAGGAVAASRTRPRSTALLVVWILVPFAVALTFGTLSFPRHVMYLLPPMIVLMAFALERLAAAALAAWPRRTALAACAVGVAVTLGPAVVADARFLGDPRGARYPGPDDLQFVRGTQAGAPWPGVAGHLERRGRGPRVDVVLFRSYPDVVRFLLDPEGRFRLIDTRSPDAARAQFLIRDESDFVFPDDPGPALVRGRFREAARFERPRGGAVVQVYENSATAVPAR
jgi:hypothetical protein